jgi:hypothetical protein
MPDSSSPGLELDQRLAKLKEVNERIAEGERLIAEQKASIAYLQRKREDTAEARELLDALIASQRVLLQEREALFREVERRCLGQEAPEKPR